MNQTQMDLRRASRTNRHSHKERERYDNAQHHLSDFDRRMVHGRFDKDKLDEAIGDVDHVLKNNTLAPEARDALSRDLEGLRELRARRGAAY